MFCVPCGVVSRAKWTGDSVKVDVTRREPGANIGPACDDDALLEWVGLGAHVGLSSHATFG